MKKSDIFCYWIDDGFCWFRIFGIGLVIKDINKHSLLFSERVFNKGLQIGKWRIRYLPKYYL
jgi:hypothetical protein